MKLLYVLLFLFLVLSVAIIAFAREAQRHYHPELWIQNRSAQTISYVLKRSQSERTFTIPPGQTVRLLTSSSVRFGERLKIRTADGSKVIKTIWVNGEFMENVFNPDKIVLTYP